VEIVMMNTRRWLVALVAMLSLVPGRALAQGAASPPVVQSTDNMSFDRPEAWALKHFTSATLLEGLDVPRTRAKGAIDFGLEVSWLPALSDAQRLIGFGGTKPEDLNKAPIFLRPRVTIGLPGRFALTLAGVPPVRTFGVKALLGAVALERPVYESPTWVVGLRGYGQMGHVDAAFTCPQSVLAFAPNSAQNLYGCRAESSDRSSFRYVGGEVGFGYRTGSRVSPHAAVSVNYLNMQFQVNALRDDVPGHTILDHALLLAHGVTMAVSGGVSYRLASRVNAAIDAFYTPLSIRRPGSTAAQNDGLFTIRALFTYRIR
jgi:hypothetical protein